MACYVHYEANGTNVAHRPDAHDDVVDDLVMLPPKLAECELQTAPFRCNIVRLNSLNYHSN